VLFAVLVVTGAATAAMVVPAGVTEFGVASVEGPSDHPQVVEPGGTAELDYEVHNGGVLPVLVLIEPASDGVTVERDRAVLGAGERAETTVRAEAPERPDVYLRHVRETRYLLVLPPGVVAGLHAVHPLVALLVVDLVIAAFVLALGIAVFGTGQLRLRAGPSHVPLRTRLDRRMRKWL
jgi:signal peptidase